MKVGKSSLVNSSLVGKFGPVEKFLVCAGLNEESKQKKTRATYLSNRRHTSLVFMYMMNEATLGHRRPLPDY